MINKNEITKPPEKVILFGKEFTKLLSQGKDAWNTWVEDNPDADINFAPLYLANRSTVFSFVGFNFPKGNIALSKMEIINHYGHYDDIDFSGVDFRQSTVDVSYINMSNKTLSFVGTRFGAQNISFANSQLGSIDFTDASFSKGNIEFSNCTFASGRDNTKVLLNFKRTQFNSGDFKFEDSKVVNGDFNFTDATFGEGDISFINNDLPSNEFPFIGTWFNKGHFKFEFTYNTHQRGVDSIDFTRAIFDTGDISLAACVFA
jgi:uncharacterized protein YjbI with pentapeptide repeats